jgi:hypothetical protein
LEATERVTICVPAGMGRPSRIPVAILGKDGTLPLGEGKDQGEALRRRWLA